MKKRIKIPVLAAMVLLLLPIVPIFAAMPPEEETPTPAHIDYVSISMLGGGILTPGTRLALSIGIHNAGGTAAEEVSVTVSSEGLAIASGTVSGQSVLPGQTRFLSVSAELNSDFVGNSVLVNAEVSYRSADMEEGELKRQLGQNYFAVTMPTPTPTPTPPPAITVATKNMFLVAGRLNTAQIEIANSGGSSALNFQATLTPGSGLEGIWGANDISAFTSAGLTINPTSWNDRSLLTYNLNVPADVKTGSYTLSVSGTYYEQYGHAAKSFEASIAVYVQNSYAPAALKILDAMVYPVRSGEAFSATVRVQNTGGLAVRDAAVSVTNLSSETFTMSGGGLAGFIGAVPPSTTSQCVLQLKAAGSLKTGAYPLNLELKYTDAENQSQTATLQVFVEVLAPPDPELEFVRAAVPGGLLRPGESAVLTVELHNPGETAVGDVKVQLAGFSGTGLYLVEEDANLPTKAITSIPAGGMASVSYSVALSEFYATGALALQAEISAEGITAFTEDISLAVLLPSPSPTPAVTPVPSPTPASVPKLIVDRYSLSWDDEAIQTLRAGGMFDLTFSLRNTSATVALKNITVTLSSTDGTFLPAAGSNTFYIESVEAGGEIERTIRLIVAQNAETKSYPLTFGLDYEDEKGGAYRPSETLSLPVIVPQVVELSNFNPPMSTEVGMQSYLSFQYINKGKSTAYNFTVIVDGDFTLPEGASTYVGNLTSGYADYFEAVLMPNTPGEQAGAVVVRFEDAVGNVTEMREEFTILVSEPYIPEFPIDEIPGDMIGDPSMAEGASGPFGLPWLAVIIGGAGIALAALLTTFLLLRRRKKKKLAAAEEEDDGE